MADFDLKNLARRVKSWPDEAQAELFDVAYKIQCGLRNVDYFASQYELRALDAAMGTIEREDAVDLEVEAVR